MGKTSALSGLFVLAFRIDSGLIMWFVFLAILLLVLLNEKEKLLIPLHFNNTTSN